MSLDQRYALLVTVAPNAAVAAKEPVVPVALKTLHRLRLAPAEARSLIRTALPPSGSEVLTEALGRAYDTEWVIGELRSAEGYALPPGGHSVISLGSMAEKEEPSWASWLILGEAAVEEIGVRLFGTQRRRNDVFHTTNGKLLEKEYLPTLLARDGVGIFFEDRIIGSLVRLGCVPRGARVKRIVDLGGWEDLDSLDARLHLSFQYAGTERDETLIAGALLPVLPVSIAERERQLRARASALKRIGIESTYLAIEKGVIFFRGSVDLAAWLSSNTGARRERILTSLGIICARLDSGEAELRKGSSKDALDVSELRTQRPIRHPFGVLDDHVVWADMRVDPVPFLGQRTADPRSWDARLSHILSPEELEVVDAWYRREVEGQVR